MAIAFGSFGGWAGQSGTTINMSRPTGTANGDFLVMVIATEADETHTTPTGWTLVENARNGATSGSSNLSVFYKTASNEPPTISCSVSGNNLLGIGGVYRFTGLNIAIDQAATATGSGTAVVAPSITPSQSTSMALVAVATRAGVIGPTFTAPSGFTELGDGGFYNIATELSDKALSGTSATGTQTATASATGSWTAATFNIYEGAGGGGGGGGGAASSVTFSPTGTISSTDVQSAIAEAASEAVQKASFTAKGDLLAGTGSGTLSTLAVGTDGQVLQADHTATGGVSWTAAPGLDNTAWSTYTPTITANPSNPNLGTGGTITGHYKKIGKILHFQIEVLVGTSPTVGSGTYNFSLPPTITTANYNQTCTAWFIDASIAANAGHYIGVGLVGPAQTAVTAYLAGGGVNSPGTPFAGGTPVSIASGDTFVIGGTIEVQ